MIEIIDRDFQGIYSCFYRANNAKTGMYILDETFDEFLSEIENKNISTICYGDLNINLNENNNRTKLFNETCDRYGMKNIANFDPNKN